MKYEWYTFVPEFPVVQSEVVVFPTPQGLPVSLYQVVSVQSSTDIVRITGPGMIALAPHLTQVFCKEDILELWD